MHRLLGFKTLPLVIGVAALALALQGCVCGNTVECEFDEETAQGEVNYNYTTSTSGVAATGWGDALVRKLFPMAHAQTTQLAPQGYRFNVSEPTLSGSNVTYAPGAVDCTIEFATGANKFCGSLGSTLPETGTYTDFEVEVSLAQLTLKSADVGTAPNSYRVVLEDGQGASAANQAGDLKLLDGGTWKWVDTSGATPTPATTRPSAGDTLQISPSSCASMNPCLVQKSLATNLVISESKREEMETALTDGRDVRLVVDAKLTDTFEFDDDTGANPSLDNDDVDTPELPTASARPPQDFKPEFQVEQ